MHVQPVADSRVPSITARNRRAYWLLLGIASAAVIFVAVFMTAVSTSRVARSFDQPAYFTISDPVAAKAAPNGGPILAPQPVPSTDQAIEMTAIQIDPQTGSVRVLARE
jgi:hypothetical protein